MLIGQQIGQLAAYGQGGYTPTIWSSQIMMPIGYTAIISPKTIQPILRTSHLKPQRPVFPVSTDSVSLGTLPADGYNGHVISGPISSQMVQANQPSGLTSRRSNANIGTISNPANYSDVGKIPYLEIRKPLEQYPQYTVDGGAISNIPDFILKSPMDVQQQELINMQVIYADSSDQQQTIKNLFTSQSLFTDDTFPTNEEMMCGDLDRNSTRYQQRIETLAWRRFQTVYPDSEIFKGGIRPSDLKQGGFGTCYFLVGLSALAQRPQRIRDLFLWKQLNRSWVMACNLILRGRWKTVYVDDNFPLPKNQYLGKAGGCALGSPGQMWVSILEKAWAKLYRNYANSESGFTEEALHDLTGAHIKFIRPQDHDFDPEATWKTLLHATERRYVMLGESPTGSDTNISQSGMVFGHAYTVLGAYEVKALGQIVRLVKCRNPWGFQEWVLDWHDTDPRWNAIDPKVKQSIGYSRNTKNGEFFMSYNNFYAWMKKITIAYVHDGNSYVYHTLTAENGVGKYFKVTVFKEGWYSFQLNQTPAKLHRGKPNYNYSPATINIGKLLPGGQLEWKKGTQSAYRTAFRKLKLDAGSYIVYTQLWFQETDPYREVTLAICAEHYCQIIEALATDTNDFHRKLFLSKARAIAKPIATNIKYIEEVLEYQGFLYAAVFNNTLNPITVKVRQFKDYCRTCKNLNPNVKFIEPFERVVAAGEQFIVLERIPTCGVWTSNLCGIEIK